MANSIGEHEFLSLIGQPETVREQVELIQRPGVDGVGIWKTGIRGKPFKLRSQCDAADKETARDMYLGYCELIGADAVPLVWSDLDLDSLESVLVAVLNVTPLDIRSLLNSSEGLNPPSLGWVECEWELVAISTDTASAEE